MDCIDFQPFNICFNPSDITLSLQVFVSSHFARIKYSTKKQRKIVERGKKGKRENHNNINNKITNEHNDNDVDDE